MGKATPLTGVEMTRNPPTGPRYPKLDPSEFKPGLYDHYKGGKYVALMLVQHHDTREHYVVYVSQTKGTVNIRPWSKPGEDSWCDWVDWSDGVKRPRFFMMNP